MKISYLGALVLATLTVAGCGDMSDLYHCDTSVKEGCNKIDFNGPTGPAGANGTNGTNGTDGKNGATGAQGPQGIQGEAGPQGPAGEAGQNGAVGATGAQGVAGQNYTPPTVTADQQEVNNLVNQYNINRTFVGQEDINPGLDCVTQFFGTPAVPQQPASIAQATGGAGYTLYNGLTFTYTGNFNQPNTATSNGLNVFPSSVQANPTYQNWYLLTCTGYIVITTTNYYTFQLSSDDGSILNVNGFVINNDGNHAMQTVSGTTTLDQGIYSFKLQYMQASGNEALIINSNGSLLGSQYLYH